MSESGTPGRYARTTNGLIAAMVVTVVAVGAFVLLRTLTGDDDALVGEPVDYLETVQQIQDGGLEVVYPASLPEGWIATNVAYQPGERPEWFVGMLTEDDRFVGLRQLDSSTEDLLEEYVDADAEPLAAVTVEGSVASRWEGFRDEGGDTAYVATLGEDRLLVYGSAPAEDLEQLLARLTTGPLGR